MSTRISFFVGGHFFFIEWKENRLITTEMVSIFSEKQNYVGLAVRYRIDRYRNSL